MIKMVVFDCYGTLVNILTQDSEWVWQCVKTEIERLTDREIGTHKSLKHSYYARLHQEKERQSGMGAFREYKEEGVFRKVLFDMNIPEEKITESVLERILFVFRVASLKELNYYPNVPQILMKLKGRGLKLALLSNAQEQYIKSELDGIWELFDYAIISSEIGEKKPGTEIFNRLFQESGIPSEECVMVGDSIENDMVPARFLGMKTVYIVSDKIADKTMSSNDYKSLPNLIESLEEKEESAR